MKSRIYNFLVNRHPGIRDRYHAFHDGSYGFKKLWSYVYLLWLNWCYYVFFCRFLGKKKGVAIYESKKLKIDISESEYYTCNMLSVEAFVAKLSSYDVISFDIFDTLIFRPFSKPTDLFYLIGNELGIMNFTDMRKAFEWEARKQHFAKEHNYEVTLEEIWNLIERECGIDAKTGMEIEKELELKLCYANPFMKQVFDELIKRGKRVVIVSDMYLPQDVLEEVLHKAGYEGYEKLYVSCEYGINKYEGKLYDYVIKDSELTGTRIHVGDNVISDVNSAKAHGFDSLHYPNVNEDQEEFRAMDMSPIVGGAYRGIVNNRLHCGLNAYSMEYEYGYTYGGLFVTGYCNFIHEYCKKNEVDKILFLSRDGDILCQAYKKMFPSDNTEYVYWSRKVATKLMAKYDRYDYFRRFLYHKVNQGKSIEDILKSMEIDWNYDITGELTNKNVDVLKEKLLADWDKVLANYEEEQRLAAEYYSKVLKGCKKAVAVDIGWAGSGAIALNTLVSKEWNIPCEIIGIVAGTNTVHNSEPYATEAFFQSGKLVSYMYSMSHNTDLMKKHDPNRDYNVYWELLLSSPTPQFVGFGAEGLRFGKYDDNLEGIKMIQEGILDFVNDYLIHFDEFSYMLNISGRDAYAPMIVAASKDEKYLKAISIRFNLDINVN